jgi:hypothetical protein
MIKISLRLRVRDGKRYSTPLVYPQIFAPEAMAHAPRTEPEIASLSRTRNRNLL